MRIVTFITGFLFAASTVAAQDIKIAVFNDQQVTSVTLNIKEGKYRIRSGNNILGEYKRGAIFYLTRMDKEVQVRDKRNFIGSFPEVEFDCESEDGVVFLKPVNPALDGREYDDNFIFRTRDNYLQMINKLDMEKYVAAVIQAEGGDHAPAEYYKAQAVLVRTFTIKNMFKHAEEGFNLCDQTHCQAYNGRISGNQEILSATRSTAGKVLIGKDSVLIMSPFHSNCGGETSSAGMVWQRDLPYLQSVKDPFCLNSPHATWTKTIDRPLWIHYVDSVANNHIGYSKYNFSFTSDHRIKNVMINGLELNMRSIREYFNLNSAFFSINDSNGKISFNGRGYGHGVGMCQEGAMEMAKVGYSWLDIIHYYFQGVMVTDYREMKLNRY